MRHNAIQHAKRPDCLAPFEETPFPPVHLPRWLLCKVERGPGLGDPFSIVLFSFVVFEPNVGIIVQSHLLRTQHVKHVQQSTLHLLNLLLINRWTSDYFQTQSAGLIMSFFSQAGPGPQVGPEHSQQHSESSTGPTSDAESLQSSQDQSPGQLQGQLQQFNAQLPSYQPQGGMATVPWPLQTQVHRSLPPTHGTPYSSPLYSRPGQTTPFTNAPFFNGSPSTPSLYTPHRNEPTGLTPLINSMQHGSPATHLRPGLPARYSFPQHQFSRKRGSAPPLYAPPMHNSFSPYRMHPAPAYGWDMPEGKPVRFKPTKEQLAVLVESYNRNKYVLRDGNE